MLKHVMVPLDESELAESALPYAREIVDASTGKITLIGVVYVPEYITSGLYPVPFEYQIENYEDVRKTRVNNAKDYLEKIVHDLQRGGLQAEIVVRTGNPADRIVETAEELAVDAIVMSTHGRSGFNRWIFGSVTQKVLNATPCPVMVIPPVH